MSILHKKVKRHLEKKDKTPEGMMFVGDPRPAYNHDRSKRIVRNMRYASVALLIPPLTYVGLSASNGTDAELASTSLESSPPSTSPDRDCSDNNITVMKGDTLRKLAQICGLLPDQYSAFAQINGLEDPNLIKIGDVLYSPKNVALDIQLPVDTTTSTPTTIVLATPATTVSTIIPEAVVAPPVIPPQEAAVTTMAAVITAPPELLPPLEPPVCPPNMLLAGQKLDSIDDQDKNGILDQSDCSGRPNDGVLATEACAKIGGIRRSFAPGESLTSYYASIGLSAGTIADLFEFTSLRNDTYTNNVFADIPGDETDLRECVFSSPTSMQSYIDLVT